MSARKLNALELKIHQSAIAEPKNTLTQKKLEVLAPDATARTAALNFLLGTGTLKVLKDTKGNVSFRAVKKNEMDVKKDLSGEEAMVLGHIQASTNEGIWTKHLKGKTELHQTVIDRCLKSLVSKQLVKVVKSVKHPTRKIYMMSHLDPSVEMTGGPWYTDNELDTEFIKLLSSACLHFVRDRSFPKQKGVDGDNVKLFPISAAPSYPTAQNVQQFLGKSKITETNLRVEHVEMLLNVLILDGEIEKLPAFGAAMWEASRGNDEESESENESPKKKKKKEKEESRKRKRRKDQRANDPDTESDEETRRKRSRKRRRADESDSETSSEDDDTKRKKTRKKRKADSDSDEPKKKTKKTKKRPKRTSGSSEDDSVSDSKPEEETDLEVERHSRKPSRRKRSLSPSFGFGEDENALGGAHVYRAIRQERVALGWSQAPCSRCPILDFCKEDGPVNPSECMYYEQWLASEMIKLEM